MDTAMYQTATIIALVVFLVAGPILLARPERFPARQAWMAPAGAAALLFAWTLLAIAREGPVGFWPHHLSDAWGVQIWMDLLLSAGTAFALLAPRARAVGMNPLPWFVTVALSGSIGLLAMAARYLFLAHRAPRPPARNVGA